MEYAQSQRVHTTAARRVRECLSIMLIVAVASACSMHSTRSAPPPTPSDVQTASALAIHCINLAIPQFDDGVSSADIVGRSAVLSCSQSVDAVIDTEIRAELPNRTDDLDLRDKFKQTFYNVATSMVLKHRAAELK